jgi:hypothetical protein
MKKPVTVLSRLLFLLITSFGITEAAFADTNYQCLNQCINNGKSSYVCMSACSYNAVKTPVKPLASSSAPMALPPLGYSEMPVGQEIPKDLANHHVLEAPTPLTNQVLLAKPYHPVAAPAKDYQCMTNCLGVKLPYTQCEQQCELEISNGHRQPVCQPNCIADMFKVNTTKAKPIGVLGN